MIRDRDDGERVRPALGGEGGALERIEGDVDLGALAGADLLADKEHRRLVALALADDDRAVDAQSVQGRAHGVDGGLVGGLLVAAPHQARGGEGRPFGHADDLEGQVAVHALRVAHAVLCCPSVALALRDGGCAASSG